MYKSNELKIIHQHVENAIDLLLHGLQNLGQLINTAGRECQITPDEIANIGFLFLGLLI